MPDREPAPEPVPAPEPAPAPAPTPALEPAPVVEPAPAPTPALEPVQAEAQAELAAVTARAGYRLLDLVARRAWSAPGLSRALPPVSRYVRRRLPPVLPAYLAASLAASMAAESAPKPVPVADAPAGPPLEPPLGWLDRPSPYLVWAADEPLYVAGWAIGSDLVSRVHVSLDGGEPIRARLAIPRPDVERVHPGLGGANSGFELTLPPPTREAIKAGRVTLTATAEFLDGSTHTPPPVTIRVGGAPAGPFTPQERSARPAAQVAPGTGPFRLLVFTHDLGYGGGQLWLTELLVKAQQQQAFPCTVVCPTDGPLAGVLRAAGIEVHLHGHLPVNDAEAYEGRMAELAAWTTAGQFTAILVNTFISFPGAVLGTRLGLRTVWAIHESWSPSVIWSVGYPPDYVAERVRTDTERALAEVASVVFEAEATRELYLPHTAEGAAVVVDYGIDTAAIDDYCRQTGRAEARVALGLPQAGRVLLVMGTVEPRKAQLLIAMAFARLAGRYPDTTLVFVGDNGSAYAQSLRDQLAADGLTGGDGPDRVLVQPVVKNTYAWYRAADALISGSDVESLPRTILEVMAFGGLVLATDVFGVPELISNGETGFLVPSMDLQALIAGMDRLLSLPADDVERVARAGSRLVHERHDSADYARKVLDLLRDGRA